MRSSTILLFHGFHGPLSPVDCKFGSHGGHGGASNHHGVTRIFQPLLCWIMTCEYFHAEPKVTGSTPKGLEVGGTILVPHQLPRHALQIIPGVRYRIGKGLVAALKCWFEHEPRTCLQKIHTSVTSVGIFSESMKRSSRETRIITT